MVYQGQIQLAIIIPAYKGKFLSRTLDALVRQTNHSFNLYIGDDGSPDNIENIVRPYSSLLKITYKRFNENIGNKSLVAHWNRSIDLTKNEPWLWVLPDDDVPGNNCVEDFFRKMKENPKFNLYRFLTNHVNDQDIEIRKNNIPPEIESGFDFIINKLKYIRNSSVAEYIFSKDEFVKSGGFTDIPLAWGSDDIMWLKLSAPNGIYTIMDSFVNLRQSPYNISSDSTKLKYIKTKAIHLSLSDILNQSEFKERLLDSHNLAETIKVCQQYIFNNYKSYHIRFNLIRIFRYAYYNKNILKGSYIKNIYRIVRYIIKKQC